MWMVKYQVEGFDGERDAGPYHYAEAVSQLEDIASYEGVHSAYLATASTPKPESSIHRETDDIVRSGPCAKVFPDSIRDIE